uniref:Kinase-like protein n=1 Tax=Rhizophagus irregularis (strain DAOM 181602 / DAOM 197198 / MUCL 43194) TaxID=747089 RepID=U9SJ25_RHIID
MNLKDVDQNKNVMRFYGVTKEPSKKYYSMVFQQQCYGENLKDYLENKNNIEKMDWTLKIKIAADISNGLVEYIHKANIVHRVLCPKYILDHDGTFVIIGFNQSVSLDHLSELDDLKEISDPGDNIYVDPMYYIELYESAWSNDPKKRPSIEEIARSLGDIDINHLYQDSDYIPNVYLKRNNAPSKKEACLFINKGLYEETPYLFLTQNETFVGRTESNHIIIKDQELGKQHAKIKSFQGKVEIFDLGSKSGIYVNDKKLEFRASQTLEKDDLIKLGRAVFQYLPAGKYENRMDKLLPVYNTDYLRKSLENEFENARENKQSLSFLFFDVDKFGEINKQHSHESGVHILKELSELIKNEHIGPKDIFARYGGDEFTILLNNTTDAKSASEIAEKI